ncbi:unnamed protein product, partial [Prorocentrum cordatum]
AHGVEHSDAEGRVGNQHRLRPDCAGAQLLSESFVDSGTPLPFAGVFAVGALDAFVHAEAASRALAPTTVSTGSRNPIRTSAQPQHRLS